MDEYKIKITVKCGDVEYIICPHCREEIALTLSLDTQGVKKC